MRREALKRKGGCRVFWGGHGCSKQRGHRGLHWCSSGCIPCDGDRAFGEDWDRTAYLAEVLDWREHRLRHGKGLPTHQPDNYRLPHRLLAEIRETTEDRIGD